MAKLITLLVAIGVCLTSGAVYLSGADFLTPQSETAVTVAVAPPAELSPGTGDIETTGSIAPALAESTQPENTPVAAPEVIPASGKIKIATRPFEVLAEPSASAPVLYGFPPRRPFRVIAHAGDFAQIQDLESGARGWIDQSALTSVKETASVAPKAKPAKRANAGPKHKAKTAAKPKPKPKAAEPKPQATAETKPAPEPVETQERRGLFGGLLGGNRGRSNSKNVAQRGFGFN